MFATIRAASTFATPAKGEPAPPARGKRAEFVVADSLKQSATRCKKRSSGLRNLFDSDFPNRETGGREGESWPQLKGWVCIPKGTISKRSWRCQAETAYHSIQLLIGLRKPDVSNSRPPGDTPLPQTATPPRLFRILTTPPLVLSGPAHHHNRM